MIIVDAGCGEGKNASFLAAQGARVYAFDVSLLALAHGRRYWLRNGADIRWFGADVGQLALPSSYFDAVIAYGLLHCLPDEGAVAASVLSLQRATRIGGYNVVCVFNDRGQDLSAHPGFRPCLLAHAWYENAYRDWRIVSSTDRDLVEAHPHNSLVHRHSMTRILAQRVRHE